jgi:hypothetical protein
MPRRLWAARPRRQVSATYHGSLTHLRVGARERYHKLSGDGLTRSSNVTKATGGGCTPGALAAVPRVRWRRCPGCAGGASRACWRRCPGWAAGVSLAAAPRSRRPPQPGPAAGRPRRAGPQGAGLAEAGLAGAALAGAGSKQASPEKAWWERAASARAGRGPTRAVLARPGQGAAPRCWPQDAPTHCQPPDAPTHCQPRDAPTRYRPPARAWPPPPVSRRPGQRPWRADAGRTATTAASAST